MAAIASKLGASLTGISVHSGATKMLAAGLVNTQVPKANIYSKTSGMLEPRVKPWPVDRLGYNFPFNLLDGTTKRFNDNTKMIIVDGPPALEKSKFAKELADELDMLYVPPSTMDQYYINGYGYDLRELDHKFTHIKNISYDEKKFAQDPTGQDGGLDRMLNQLQRMRYQTYCRALCHLFNTGQGIVMEKSPYSDYVYIDSALQQGWIDRTTKVLYYKTRANIMVELMKPNLIIYLDAPLDVVQSKIRARAQTSHPWEKNSPVYNNRDYMKHCYYDLLKNEYMKEASIHSQVLMYDWSDGGDTEVVVEDIERLNMDWWDKHDKQQQDWRLFRDEKYSEKRQYFSNHTKYMSQFHVDYFTCDKVLLSAVEAEEFHMIAARVPGETYRKGMNPDMGDPNFVFQPVLGQVPTLYNDDGFYTDNVLVRKDIAHMAYLEEREERRKNGEERWWQF